MSASTDLRIHQIFSYRLQNFRDCYLHQKEIIHAREARILRDIAKNGQAIVHIQTNVKRCNGNNTVYIRVSTGGGGAIRSSKGAIDETCNLYFPYINCTNP